MERYAEGLWRDGYNVYPDSVELTFDVRTPSGKVYNVAPLDERCTCAYQQKHAVPFICCKHLCGLEMLIKEQLIDYLNFYNQNKNSDPIRAAQCKERHDVLKARWEYTVGYLEIQSKKARTVEEEADGKDFMDDLNTRRYLLR